MKCVMILLSLVFLSSCMVKPDAAVQEAYDLDVVKEVVNVAPVAGNHGLVRITALGPAFISIEFELATDDHTAKTELQYRLVSSSSESSFTVDQTVFNWMTLAQGSYQIVLNDFKARNYRLDVRDQQGMSSSYLFFTHAPILPDSTTLTLVKTGEQSAALSWNKSAHLYIDATALQYKVVRSTSNNISTLEQAEANGVVEIDWSNDISNINLSGLVTGTEYYYMVFVRTPFAVVKSYSPLHLTF